MMKTYPLSFALEDFVPLLFSAIGLFLIARAVNRKNPVAGELAYIGAALIVAGEFLRAGGKLLIAVTGNDHPLVISSQLVLLAPGFVCFAWALWRGLQDGVGEMTAGQVWLLPLFLNAALLALSAATRLVRGTPAAFFILLLVTTVAGIAANIQLARRALHHRLTVVTMLFLLNMMMTLALQWLDGESRATPSAEWAGQISDTLSQGAFAFAAYRLVQAESNSL